jgi:hypothetical protein
MIKRKKVQKAVFLSRLALWEAVFPGEKRYRAFIVPLEVDFML